MAVKVCLDAGHYGKYNRSPAVSSYYESDMTWKLHNYLKKELESFGIVVVTTRTNQNTDRALYERGAASKGCKDIASYPTDLKYYQFLKNKWKVSIQAMIYRTHQLGIMSDNQYQYLMRQVSKNGWRIKEPGDVPYSLNENIFQGAIDLLIEQNVLTAKEILDLFKKNGVTLYPEDMEELLHLRPDTLKVEEKVVPILQLRKK